MFLVFFPLCRFIWWFLIIRSQSRIFLNTTPLSFYSFFLFYLILEPYPSLLRLATLQSDLIIWNRTGRSLQTLNFFFSLCPYYFPKILNMTALYRLFFRIASFLCCTTTTLEYFQFFFENLVFLLELFQKLIVLSFFILILRYSPYGLSGMLFILRC